MNHPDNLQLAAFVESRLSATERSRVVAHLAECAECAELIAETRRFLDGPASAETRQFPAPDPARPRRAGRWYLGGAIGAAAVAAALLWAVPGIWRLGIDAVPGVAAELAQQLEPRFDDSLAERVWRQPSAGFAFASRMTREVAEFRWGVAAVDLELAAVRSDPRAVERVANGIQSWQQSAPSSLRGERLIKALSERQASEWLEPLRRLETRLQESSNPAPFALGRWAEACRLAALSGDEALLRNVLASRPRPDTGGPEVLRAISEIDALTPSGTSIWDLPTLATAFRDLILLH